MTDDRFFPLSALRNGPDKIDWALLMALYAIFCVMVIV